MIDAIMDFATGNALLIVIGLGLSWGVNRILAAIKGTALEAELGELIELAVEAGKDKKITAKEGRKLGKQGIDTLKALKEFLASKKDDDEEG